MYGKMWAATAMAVSMTAAAAVASPIVGVWRAPVNDAVIEIYDCGPQVICGRVVASNRLRAHPDMRDVHNPDPSVRLHPVKGLQMMRDFRGGPSHWEGGLFYNPDDGHSYHGALTLVDADTLKLAGCLIGPLCLTQTWTRAR
jgi:uncharacterized protein (DUF2147 family)